MKRFRVIEGHAGETPDGSEEAVLTRGTLATTQDAMNDAPMRGPHLQELPSELGENIATTLRETMSVYAKPEHLEREHLMPETAAKSGFFEVVIRRIPSFRASKDHENPIIQAIAEYEAGRQDDLFSIIGKVREELDIMIAIVASSEKAPLAYMKFMFRTRDQLLKVIDVKPEAT